MRCCDVCMLQRCSNEAVRRLRVILLAACTMFALVAIAAHNIKMPR